MGNAEEQMPMGVWVVASAKRISFRTFSTFSVRPFTVPKPKLTTDQLLSEITL
jgi:hypothetical protein